ncbi:GNAT family N-acetyltransferase [Zobellia galactanivorans]|uniref:GCN5-related N-acetyltransferase n=1 Tax=Zobellia galactanivorans (strain DSM 12802 / CCUG 47099 / CIP 106680 / NCIMB 13871 / Dsij) TaxID=63186 RepID=G0LAV7_ZOBGA|nr:GNAT family N-acetyltransferase [Zobellia galactanivorans]MBU3027937.1 GNAT family N-acetyltransferase [Zobellia galactanivorans]CAZ95598.1 GCN5-related N-acetyltransferase [Zobellia galactanivorans]
MIRPAKRSEIGKILNLTQACAAAMMANGIYQWNEHYPSRQAFECDVDRKELYVLEEDNQIIGTMVISTFMDEEYKPVRWLTPTDKNCYIHRVAVHPDFQGKGYAQQLMGFAENYAREKGFSSLRLDTFSQNKRNQRFYEARGFQRLGDIFFPKQSGHPFHCYELVL